MVPSRHGIHEADESVEVGEQAVLATVTVLAPGLVFVKTGEGGGGKGAVCVKCVEEMERVIYGDGLGKSVDATAFPSRFQQFIPFLLFF